ncbi:halocyanin [Haladaptatus sp. W1]|uniref:plastocyanin/azurin family copper-binding protein n=1 Tax=Haladaptatus sp. W1 TaxID=1897478 RepID=UPI00084974C4|nr:plastocyanin/azurin family copper-binding protein [Haladaptatus sp. W1]ODR83401.1 halocyanin [Haladaptatus sp. W1]
MTSIFDRRAMLKATGTVLVGASLGGCLADGNSGSESDDSPADVTVVVGPGGDLTFDPDDLEITTGTTVAWKWEGNNHNIVVEDQPDGADWNGTPGADTKIYNEGYRYTYTFDVPGTYDYYCNPHRAAGMVGSITVTKDGKGTNGTEDGTGTDPDRKGIEDGGKGSETGGPTIPEDHATAADLPVRVGPDGDRTFTPGTERPLVVPAGTEVTFVWETDGNNIVVEDQPHDASWTGTTGGMSRVYDAGYEYSHTFDVPGTYEFYSAPYESAGMTGTIYVTK